MTPTSRQRRTTAGDGPFSRHRRARAVLLLLACVFASGCTKFVKDLGEISKLQAQLMTEFGEKEVGVNLNNDIGLTISFVNSPLNERSAEERAKRAEQTVALVKDHYPSISRMEVIWVAFVRAKTAFAFAYSVETIAVFSFDRDGQPLRSPDGPPAPDGSTSSAPDGSLRPSAVYSPDANQTEITVRGLPLQGALGQGLSVSAHFTVPGDATGVRRSDASPKSVIFDFASYSEKSLFPGEPKIQLVADGKVVFATAAQFSTSKNTDGLFTEFLKLEIPYPAFRRLAAGDKLTFKLGEYEYNLTDEQADALREMTEFVRD